jgi:hypothetical protein
VPNVAGLLAAPDLLTTLTVGESVAYGPHTTATRVTADEVTLTNARGDTVALFNGTGKGVVRAKLALIDGDTVTPVNAFLRPFGKVKSYWRAAPGTNPYRWHPLNGTPVGPEKGTKGAATPVSTLAPAAVVESREAARAAKVAAAQAAPKAHVGITVQPFATARVSVPGEVAAPAKPAVVKGLTKTYAAVGKVLTTHQNVRALTSAWAKRKAGRPAGVIITGPAGTAKTRLAQEFAASQGVPFLKVDGSSIQTANDWYGQFIPAAGGFEWAWTPLALALQRGDPMVILVDEINRVENERALNGLLGLLDFTGTYTPVGAPSEVRLPAGILVVATLNEGVEYVGTVEVDAAVRDRFGLGVRMDYPPENVEVKIITQEAPGLDREVAKRLVRIANSQRGKRHDDTLYPSGNVISTRVLISIAEDITLTGATPSEALWTAIRGRFIPEDEAALTVLIEAQFGATPVDASTLADDDDLERMLAAD